jgi:hypothetical protein
MARPTKEQVAAREAAKLVASEPQADQPTAAEQADSSQALLPQMTTSDLLTIIATMQKQLMDQQRAQTEANQALAEAIMESRKPYEDPKKKINDEIFKKQENLLTAQLKSNTKFTQDQCEHIAGCNQLSEQKDLYGKTSIAWHRGDIGQVFGVCTVCQRIFHQDDPDFQKWKRMPSFNKMSASGSRWVSDPVAAQQRSRLKDSFLSE